MWQWDGHKYLSYKVTPCTILKEYGYVHTWVKVRDSCSILTQSSSEEESSVVQTVAPKPRLANSSRQMSTRDS